jgi:protein-L-isoaspartate O-methyltransferase
MNKLQRQIYNEGERLVPYVSHNDDELVRHRSSYAFFHAVIAADMKAQPPAAEKIITVSDLGFGSGYGCALLSSLPQSRITGVDIGPECEIFANQYYPRTNVHYVIEDLATYIPNAGALDYVVSRGVLEHVPNGLKLIDAITFNKRVMVDVPYDEAPGNEHHVLTSIREDTFAHFADAEIFYEDLEGRIYTAAQQPKNANMIMLVLSAKGLPKIADMFAFPMAPVHDTALEVASNMQMLGKHYHYETPTQLLAAVEKAVRETETVLDIGCGIAPMNYFRPKMHFMVEPWAEYADILAYRYAGDKSVMLLRTGGLEALKLLGDNSVDSIFLLDVIEHMEKDMGQQVIAQAERVAREQIIIFTPLGFMPQHVEHGQKDGWGLSGTEMQEHRSGWEPNDFSAEWSFYICNEFHSVDFKGEKLETTYGAFFAIRNFHGKSIALPNALSDVRKPLPSEVEAEALRVQHSHDQQEIHALRGVIANSRALRFVRFVRRFLKRLGA